jgi:hypothetical protein
MGTRAEELRLDIADERRELAESIEAIGDRVSPGRMMERRTNRLRDRFTSIRHSVMGPAHGVMDHASHAASGMADSTSSMASGVGGAITDAPHAAVDGARGNPVAAGMIAFGAGLLAAAVFPPSRTEVRLAAQAKDAAAPLADEAKAAAKAIASDVQDQAKAAAAQVKDVAAEGAHEVAQTASSATEATAESAKSAVDEVKQQV